jgi:hypothetical protein
VQVDPGDDAPLFDLEQESTFTTALGTWTVHRLGEGEFTHYMAMLRHDGLVYQVTGGGPEDPEPAEQLARTLQVVAL